MSRYNPTKKRAGLVRANKYAAKDGKAVCIGVAHMTERQAQDEARMKIMYEAYQRDRAAQAEYKALPWYRKLWRKIRRKLNG